MMRDKGTAVLHHPEGGCLPVVRYHALLDDSLCPMNASNRTAHTWLSRPLCTQTIREGKDGLWGGEEEQRVCRGCGCYDRALVGKVGKGRGRAGPGGAGQGSMPTGGGVVPDIPLYICTAVHLYISKSTLPISQSHLR